MKSCITCGMPLVAAHEKDLGMETSEGAVCIHDMKDGKIKSAADIYEGGVSWFADAVTGGDRALAQRLTRRNMNQLAYWKAHPDPILKGDQATEEEFGAAMAKL